MSIPADDDRRLSEQQADIYLGFKRGTLRQRRKLGQPPRPAEIDQAGTAYYRLGDLRSYSRGDHQPQHLSESHLQAVQQRWKDKEQELDHEQLATLMLVQATLTLHQQGQNIPEAVATALRTFLHRLDAKACP